MKKVLLNKNKFGDVTMIVDKEHEEEAVGILKESGFTASGKQNAISGGMGGDTDYFLTPAEPDTIKKVLESAGYEVEYTEYKEDQG